jgi:hypothetical protein
LARFAGGVDLDGVTRAMYQDRVDNDRHSMSNRIDIDRGQSRQGAASVDMSARPTREDGAGLREHEDGEGRRDAVAEEVTDLSIDLGLDGTTELRVHGVSGTPPEAVLDHPLLKRVAGDKVAGFFRRWYPGGISPDLRARRRLEGYSWGGLTSGDAKRAFWLVLLPFMLANVAHWALPAVPAQPTPMQARMARLAVSLLRLFGLALTLSMLLTVIQAAVDIAGWQCGRVPKCAESSKILGLLTGGLLDTPGRRVAVTAVIPLAVVVIVGLIGRRPVRLTSPEPVDATYSTTQVPLTRRSFWRGNPGMAILRTSHVAAATALLAALVAWPATSLVAHGTARVVGLIVCWGALALFAAAVVLVGAEGTTGREAGAYERRGVLGVFFSQRGATAVRWLALGLLVVATIYSAWDWQATWREAGRMPGLRPAVLITFGVQLVLLALLTIAVTAQRPWRQGEGGFRVFMRGYGAPVLASLAFLLGAGFSAGLTYRVAELFGHPVLSQRDATIEIATNTLIAEDPRQQFATRVAAATAETPIVIPPSFAWAGAAATVMIFTIVAILGFLAWDVYRRIPSLVREIVSEYEAVESDPQARPVARAVALASLTDRAARVIARIVIIAGVVLIIGLAVYASGADNWQLVQEPPLSTITRFGTWAIGLGAAGLVALFWNAYRNPTMRRTVGILWDVGCFWPRAAHPLAPPSYSERAVPELADRVALLTSQPHGRVLLSGHSQGSVLVAATVLLLPPTALPRVGLLTHGSPLRRLYTRIFPAYFGMATLREIERRVSGRWRNLYRDTDPIGAWALEPATVPNPAVDRRLRDPARLGREIEGHSDYWGDPAYASEVERLQAPRALP